MTQARNRRIIIISGLSGSGKSVALNALEDIGYYCIDNLPQVLLPEFASQLVQPKSKATLAAVSIDSRNLDLMPIEDNIHLLEDAGIEQQLLFIESDIDTLIRRYSETRRKHPLTNQETSLTAGIRQEIGLLDSLRKQADQVIDTSHLTPHELRERIRGFASKEHQAGPQLMFQSFGFKHGIPIDADFVFDVRCLPNPYWQEEIRHLSGLDQPIIEFLKKDDAVGTMISDVAAFVEKWLPKFAEENRSYLTVAIGCTGGRHRSVYTSESLVTYFRGLEMNVQAQHRDLVVAS